ENSDFSFFLMKDRLLLYDETRKRLLTENHYSPSEILQISKANFLFVTRLGSSSEGIVNFGIYNTKSFQIVSELLNDFQSIEIIPENNKIWLYKKSTSSIHCFELKSKSG